MMHTLYQALSGTYGMLTRTLGLIPISTRRRGQVNEDLHPSMCIAGPFAQV